jgi:hypothetical protein
MPEFFACFQALSQTGREFRHYHKLAENSGIITNWQRIQA